jgi:hypothetical protein
MIGQNDIPNVIDMATVNVLIMFDSNQSQESAIDMHREQCTSYAACQHSAKYARPLVRERRTRIEVPQGG